MQYVFNDVFLKQISILSFDIPLNNISWCQHTKPSQRLTQPDDNKINLHCGYAYNISSTNRYVLYHVCYNLQKQTC